MELKGSNNWFLADNYGDYIKKEPVKGSKKPAKVLYRHATKYEAVTDALSDDNWAKMFEAASGWLKRHKRSQSLSSRESMIDDDVLEGPSNKYVMVSDDED